MCGTKMIFVTGATGFTGSFVIKQLQNRKIPFCCLVRNNNKADELKNKGISVIEGDVQNRKIYDDAFTKCDGIINIVSFNQEHIPLVIEKAKQHNIKRLLFISTTAIFTKLNASSKMMRQKFEKVISSSELNWTVLRPTMIYGYPGDRNMERLIKVLNRFPVHPILGDGKSLIQPVHVEDLATAIIDAYLADSTIQKFVNISGKRPYNYRDSVKIVSTLLGKKVTFLPIPMWVSMILSEICKRIPGLPNVSAEQVQRLNEDKNFDHGDAFDLFNFKPMDFESGMKIEIEKLKENNAIN